ncbi:MAG TPA: hypothetical protein VK926_08090 [Gaiellaceae bacterium]|nr:hypothetical protein [Gaiellaceae bacterium]
MRAIVVLLATFGAYAFVRNGAIYATLGERVRRVADGSAPAWAPDGSRIVYAGADGLLSVRADGTNRGRVTRAPSLIHDLHPAWRPPGAG